MRRSRSRVMERAWFSNFPNFGNPASSNAYVRLRMRNRALVAIAAVICLSTLSLAAATPPQPPPIQIHRADGPISVDGRLDDAGWQTAAKVDTFYETSPGD